MDFVIKPWNDVGSALGHFVAQKKVVAAYGEMYGGGDGRIVVSDLADPPSSDAIVLEVGGRRCAFLVLTRLPRPNNYHLFWFLSRVEVGADPGEFEIWDPGTSPSVLARALHEAAHASMETRPRRSPWKWGEDERTEIVALADALVEEGVIPSDVVARNRFRLLYDPSGGKVKVHEERFGHFLVVRRGEVSIRVARKRLLGWLIDVWAAEDGEWRRVAPNRIASEVASGPGVPVDAVTVDGVADAVFGITEDVERGDILANGWFSDGEDDRYVVESGQSPNGAIVAQLNRLGFVDVVLAADGRGMSSEAFHVVRNSGAKRLGLPGLKQLFADAAIENKTLVVVSESGFARTCKEFSSRSESYLFYWDSRQEVVVPANDRAWELAFE